MPDRNILVTTKVKVKFTPEQAMKAQMSTGIALIFL